MLLQHGVLTIEKMYVAVSIYAHSSPVYPEQILYKQITQYLNTTIYMSINHCKYYSILPWGKKLCKLKNYPLKVHEYDSNRNQLEHINTV